MRFDSAPDRHRWLSNNSMMVAAKLATSPKSNWTSVKIGDVVEKISTGTTPPSQERRYYDGDIDWYTPSDIGGVRWLTNPKKTITSEAVNEKKARMFDAGTILITCIGQIGRVGILPKESSSNQQITGVKFISEIDPEFAYFSLFAKQDELEAAAPTASTLSILNQNRLSEIDFSYPSTKEQKQIAEFLAWCEDRLLNSKPFTNDFPALPDYLNDVPRIVAHIESLAARVNEAQRLREEADEEANILLHSIKAKVFEIEGNTTVKDFADIQSGYAFKSEWFSTEGIRLVRNVNIGHGDIRWGDTARIPFERQNDFPAFELHEGDILISLDRPLISSGLKAARVRKQDLPSLLLQRVGRVVFKNGKVLPDYFYQWLNSPSFISSIDPGRSNGIPHISPKDVEKIPFAPPPLDEQRRIVAYLDGLQAKVNAVRELQSQSQEELDALLPSVLDRAFKGELLTDIEHKNTSVKYAALEVPYTPGVIHRSPKIVLVSKNCLLGAIAGDMVGQRYEHHRATHERFPLFTERSHFTDDTVLTLAVADGILHGGEYLKSIVEYAKRYPNAGYGGYFRDWLHANEHEPYNSFGNGSAMRVSPIGWAFDTVDDVLREAERSAAVTHNHPEGIKGAQAVALSIFRARNGASKEDIRAEIQERFGYDMSRTLAEIAPVYEWDVTCQKSVPESIIAFLESTDYESAIRNAIMLGGDADTMAAIAGSIAEAYYGGVPAEIAEEVMKRLTPDLKSTLEEFGKRFGTKIIE